jgi:hypothetical protein
MRENQLALAAENVASQVIKSMQGLRENLDPEEVIYIYALVVPDDFAYVMGYANTTRHLAASGGSPSDKWYFAGWFTEGMDKEDEVLTKVLGSADFNDDKTVQHDRQAAWLIALAEGLALARAKGALEWRGHPVIAFCSMVDSLDAGWIEQSTARMANPPKLLATFEEEFTAFLADRYGNTGPLPLQSTFERIMRERGGSPC